MLHQTVQQGLFQISSPLLFYGELEERDSTEKYHAELD